MADGPELSPLNSQFLLIKWIVVSPGDTLDLFQVSDIIRYYEANSYEAVRLIL